MTTQFDQKLNLFGKSRCRKKSKTKRVAVFFENTPFISIEGAAFQKLIQRLFNLFCRARVAIDENRIVEFEQANDLIGAIFSTADWHGAVVIPSVHTAIPRDQLLELGAACNPVNLRA